MHIRRMVHWHRFDFGLGKILFRYSMNVDLVDRGSPQRVCVFEF